MKFYLITTELYLENEDKEVTTKFAHTRKSAEEVAELEVGDFESTFEDNNIQESNTDDTWYREDCYGNSVYVEIRLITDEDFEGDKEEFESVTFMREDLIDHLGKEKAMALTNEQMEEVSRKVGDHILEYYDWSDDIAETFDSLNERGAI